MLGAASVWSQKALRIKSFSPGGIPESIDSELVVFSATGTALMCSQRAICWNLST